MAEAADLEALNQLGPVLCHLGHRRVSLMWDGTAYHVDGVDGAGGYFSGYGASPTEALEAGLRWAEASRALRAKAVAHA